MPRFVEDCSKFVGTGSCNEAGQTLEEFLEEYDPYKYKNPCVTVDIIVLKETSCSENCNTGVKLLMIQRRNHPCIGYWALPGGFAEIHEDLIMSAKRELEEETGLINIPMEQMHVWGEEKRDPRARVITVSYMAYLKEDLTVQAGDDAKDAAWFDVKLDLISSQVSKKNEVERRIQRYELILTNQEKDIVASACIDVSSNQNTVLKEWDYTLVESTNLAFDHARMMVQALLQLQ